ncbi:MAG: hypothetical protein ABJM38_11425 [Nitratireductor sp.]
MTSVRMAAVSASIASSMRAMIVPSEPERGPGPVGALAAMRVLGTEV